MLFNDVMRPFPSGRFLLIIFSFSGVFDCSEVQPVAVVCRSSDLLVCCVVCVTSFFDDVIDVGYI
jgi:hypothetical protein